MDQDLETHLTIVDNPEAHKLERQFTTTHHIQTDEERTDIEDRLISELLAALPRDVGAELEFSKDNYRNWVIANGDGIDAALGTNLWSDGELTSVLVFYEFDMKEGPCLSRE